MRPNPQGALLVAGVDVGSSAIKVAILEDVDGGASRLILGRTERIRRRDPLKIAEEMYEACLGEAGVRAKDLAYVATTGEGETAAFRTGHFYGMTTHARGGLFLRPEARAVVDIGALHARALIMDARAVCSTFLLCLFLRLNNTCLTALIRQGDAAASASILTFGTCT